MTTTPVPTTCEHCGHDPDALPRPIRTGTMVTPPRWFHGGNDDPPEMTLDEAIAHARMHAAGDEIAYDGATPYWNPSVFGQDEEPGTYGWTWAHAGRTPRTYRPIRWVALELDYWRYDDPEDFAAVRTLAEWWLTLRPRKGTATDADLQMLLTERQPDVAAGIEAIDEQMLANADLARCPTCGATDHARCWSSPAAMIEARR